MARNVVVLVRSESGRRLVRKKCEAAGLDMSILEDLINLELDQAGKLRKHGLWQNFDDIFDTLDSDEEG